MFEFGVNREQAREIDRIAIDEYEIDGLILMENAGLRCVAEIEDTLGGSSEGSEALILCGKGNNGGDGFVVARHLYNRGAEVECFVVGEIEALLSDDSDAATNLKIARHMDIPLHEINDERGVADVEKHLDSSDIVVDALLGTGVTGDVRGLFRPLIELLNGVNTAVLSVDVPSGLDCDTGRPLGVAIRAACTVTFVLPKAGYLNPDAVQYTGEVKVADISVPVRLIEEKVRQWKNAN